MDDRPLVVSQPFDPWGVNAINMRSDAAKGMALSAPATLYVGFLVAAPLAILLAYSLWTQTYVSIDRTLTLANYREAFTDPLVRHLMIRSILIAGAVTVTTVALAYPIAYFIAFKAKRKTLWLLLITIPFWSSYLLRVFAWKLILGFNGVLNSALLGLGIIEEPLTFLLYNEFAVVLTLAHAWAPFAILPIYVSLQKIDHSLLEAATGLGNGAVQRFLRVTLPLTVMTSPTQVIEVKRVPRPRTCFCGTQLVTRRPRKAIDSMPWANTSLKPNFFAKSMSTWIGLWSPEPPQ